MHQFLVKLQRQPSVRLSCSLIEGPKRLLPESLIICISGIDNTQTTWYPMVSELQKAAPSNLPPILLYDRVGQGTSTGQNADIPGRPEGFGGDCLLAAHDIREIVTNVAMKYFGIDAKNVNDLKIIFVANSVGCAIARLYAHTYRCTVAALLLLDSTIANSDTVSLFPNPEAPGFSADTLPPGVTPELCMRARNIVRQIYHPESPNREGLWRGNLPNLLPHSDNPKLQGPTTEMPLVTVVEHDHSMFAALTMKLLGLPEALSNLYFDPKWHEYNVGLAKITKPHLSKGPIEAKGCNHLIQKDGPQFVASELLEILEKLSQCGASRI